MQSLPVPCSPLSVIYRVIVLCIVIGAAILVTLLFELLTPFWSRTVIVLQGLAVLVALMAYRWRPSWRLVFYPLLLANMAYVWDHTLHPRRAPACHGDWHRRRSAHALAAVAAVHAASHPGLRRLREPGRGCALLSAAPGSVRLHCTSTGRTTAVGRSGDEYIALMIC